MARTRRLLAAALACATVAAPIVVTSMSDTAQAGPTRSTTGWCHLDFYPGGSGNPIKFSNAYGAGIVNAAAAIG